MHFSLGHSFSQENSKQLSEIIKDQVQRLYTDDDPDRSSEMGEITGYWTNSGWLD